MELAVVLEPDGIPFTDPGRNEYPSDPALDGGHVMFLIFEVVTGRKPSDKFMEYAQITGMVILLACLSLPTE
jgi:hypothetical protein